jgi:hypothetical protein
VEPKLSINVQQNTNSPTAVGRKRVRGGGGCNRVSRLEHVESRAIEGLKDWLYQYEQQLEVDESDLEVFELTIGSLQNERKNQKNKGQAL